MIIREVIESAQLFGYTKLYLESLPHFSDAVNMYEKQGFLRLEKPLGESGHCTCNIWMITSKDFMFNFSSLILVCKFHKTQETKN